MKISDLFFEPQAAAGFPAHPLKEQLLSEQCQEVLDGRAEHRRYFAFRVAPSRSGSLQVLTPARQRLECTIRAVGPEEPERSHFHQGIGARADEDNLRDMFEIVRYVYNQVPAIAWGSPERVTAWLAGDPVSGLARGEDRGQDA